MRGACASAKIRAATVRRAPVLREIAGIAGDITLWFEEEFLRENWSGVATGKRGKPFKYSDAAIQTLLVLKAVFGLPYRALEGFSRSLMKLMGLAYSVPDHTLMSRRAKVLQIKIPCKARKGPIHVVLDSTGLKIYSEGE